MTDVLVDSFTAAVESMKSSGPRPLLKRARFEAEGPNGGQVLSLDDLIQYLYAQSLNNPFKKRFHLAFAHWDAVDGPQWTAGTPPRTDERRALIHTSLDVHADVATAFDRLFPVKTDETIVITGEFEPWYTSERAAAHEFYWRTYYDYLLEKREWDPNAVANLDANTTRVVERLCDPERVDAYPSRGLVVGYVQSGKTANFTGVLAKALDAGYRLLIVMTGTVDLLREQTQRRIDMELVGRENILRGISPSHAPETSHVDYQDDPDFPGKFVSHGFLPSENNLPDVIRLTSHRFDYKSLQAGITALEFEKIDKALPLFDPTNLHSSSARLVIVKKNKSVLQKLVRDLRSISGRLTEIPALLIDDESDQASVNTSNPKKWKEGKAARTAINGLISELLGLLPRAQYVGYTATPFANVFIDPSDVADIFPKNYLITLDRPAHYMGVTDFHDLDSTVDLSERTFENSNEKAFVRDLRAKDHDQDRELQNALDAFVLSGAIKLFRGANGDFGDAFRHHTMLVHESVKQDEHAALAAKLKDLWRNGGYSTASGASRLKTLFETDYRPVSEVRSSLVFPDDFAQLGPYIGGTVSRITETQGNPVIIVNGNKDMAQESIDFEKRSVWRVLVGGTKLSRGFTVEGLTISYYRRKTRQADTLMQMGRWFGFRRGYEDLVRLFIGREEPDGKGTLDLYEAFEAIVRDEELFRAQLRKYAEWVDGKPQVTPAQIPPLVSQHLPWLKPTSPNKMFNARLIVRRSPGTPIEPVAYPKDRDTVAHNFDVAMPLLVAAEQNMVLGIPDAKSALRGTFRALVGMIPHSVLLESLRELRWFTADYFAPDLAFLEELTAHDVSSWVVLHPQVGAKGQAAELPGLGIRSVFRRNRTRDPLFQAISDPKHRGAALRIAGAMPSFGDKAVDGLSKPRCGAVLVYPLVERDLSAGAPEQLASSDVVIAVVITAPLEAKGKTAQLVQFVAKNSAHASEPIVDAPDDAKG